MTDSPLTTTEQAELAALEAQADAGIRHFAASIEALQTIRDKNLYRAHGTWEDYFKARWEGSRSYLSRQINGLKLALALPNGNLLQNENQTRKLREYDAELQAAILRLAHSYATSQQREMTAGDIADVGNVLVDADQMGGVNLDDDGEATALFAAISYEYQQRIIRQQGHIRSGGKKRTYIVRPTALEIRNANNIFGRVQMTVVIEMDDATFFQLTRDDIIGKLQVSVWTEAE